MQYNIGLDLGKRRDHAALAVIERIDHHSAYTGSTMNSLNVVLLERIPLGTPYTVLVAAVRNLLQSDELRGRSALAVDATGVGGPVVDMLRRCQLGCDLSAVTITAGEHESTNGYEYSVPKQDLISGLQVHLELGQLRIAKSLKQCGSLVRELADVRMATRNSGRVRIGADACGEHDDLVIAVALGCWRARRRENHFGTHRLV